VSYTLQFTKDALEDIEVLKKNRRQGSFEKTLLSPTGIN